MNFCFFLRSIEKVTRVLIPYIDLMSIPALWWYDDGLSSFFSLSCVNIIVIAIATVKHIAAFNLLSKNLLPFCTWFDDARVSQQYSFSSLYMKCAANSLIWWWWWWVYQWAYMHVMPCNITVLPFYHRQRRYHPIFWCSVFNIRRLVFSPHIWLSVCVCVWVCRETMSWWFSFYLFVEEFLYESHSF